MENSAKTKLTSISLALMIFTAVYGFGNVPLAFYQMGYGAIPWYIIGAIAFFLPFSLMVTEFGSTFKNEKGGIYSWMEKSVGPGFALVGTLMWYMSWVIWFVTVGNRILIPIQNLVFGKTQNWSTLVMSLLAILIMAIVTFSSLHGISWIKKVASVGGVASVSLNFILIIGAFIVLIINGHPATPITWQALWSTPNPQLQPATFVTFIAFLVYAIFAYAGVETVGGLVDETKNPEHNFPRGILISTGIIAVGYSFMIFCTGFVINFARDWAPNLGDKLNQGNVTYYMMSNLGQKIGGAFNMGESGSRLLGVIFARYVGLSMLLALTGAMFTLIYSPVKQLIEGTPARMWPGRIGEVKGDVPRRAVIVQFFIVVVLILLNLVMSMINQGAADQFFLVMTNMGNIASSLPYVFIVLAYIRFKKNEAIEKPFVVLKNKTFAITVAWISAIVIILADLFTMIQPVIDHLNAPKTNPLSGVYTNIISMAAGPVVFAILAWYLIRHYRKEEKRSQ